MDGHARAAGEACCGGADLYAEGAARTASRVQESAGLSAVKADGEGDAGVEVLHT